MAERNFNLARTTIHSLAIIFCSHPTEKSPSKSGVKIISDGIKIKQVLRDNAH